MFRPLYNQLILRSNNLGCSRLLPSIRECHSKKLPKNQVLEEKLFTKSFEPYKRENKKERLPKRDKEPNLTTASQAISKKENDEDGDIDIGRLSRDLSPNKAQWIRPFAKAGIKFNDNDYLRGTEYDLQKAFETIVNKEMLDDPKTNEVLRLWLHSKKPRIPKLKKHFFKMLYDKANVSNPDTIQKLWDLLKAQADGKISLYIDDQPDTLPEHVDINSCAKNILPRIPKIHTQIKLVLERWANYGNIPKDKNTFFEKMHKKSIKNDAWLQETWDKLKEEANKQ